MFLLAISGRRECRAQVQVALSIVQHSATARLLNRRAAGLVTAWTGLAVNSGGEQVLVSESAILARLTTYQPLDRAAMLILIVDAAANSRLARLARLGGDMAAISAYEIAHRPLIQPLWGEVLTGIGFIAPYLVSRLKGADPPVVASFEVLSAGWPLSLGPGQSASFHVFTARWPDATPPVTFSLDGPGSAVRMLR